MRTVIDQGAGVNSHTSPLFDHHATECTHEFTATLRGVVSPHALFRYLGDVGV